MSNRLPKNIVIVVAAVVVGVLAALAFWFVWMQIHTG